MGEATEVVSFTLKEDTDPNGKAFQTLLDTIISKGKPLRMFSGGQVEHPKVQNLFIDWSSIESHIEFTKWDGYKQFLDEAVALCEAPPSLYHVHFTLGSAKQSLTGATEFLRAYFPADYSEEDQKTLHERMVKFGNAVESNWDSVKGKVAGGWAVEEVDNPNTGGKAKCYVVLAGWESVDSHMQFRETPAMKDNIHLLREAKDLQGVEVCHVAAKPFSA